VYPCLHYRLLIPEYIPILWIIKVLIFAGAAMETFPICFRARLETTPPKVEK